MRYQLQFQVLHTLLMLVSEEIQILLVMEEIQILVC